MIPSRVSFGDGAGKSVSSVGFAEPVPVGTGPLSVALGVLAHVRQLRDEPAFVGLTHRPDVAVEERDQPIRDRLPCDALADLPGDLLAAIRSLLRQQANRPTDCRSCLHHVAVIGSRPTLPRSAQAS